MQVLLVHEDPVAITAAPGDWGYPEFQVVGAHAAAEIDDGALAAAAAVLLDAAHFSSRSAILAVCRRLNDGLRSAAPIILIDDDSGLQAKLDAFAAGADDYLSRPFERAELIARLKALSRRRCLRAGSGPLQVADLLFDPRTCEVRRAGRLVPLGRIGRQILHLLMSEAPGVVTRQRLERAIWGDSPPQRDLLRSHMSMLRKAIDGGHDAKLLQTVHGTGFRLIG